MLKTKANTFIKAGTSFKDIKLFNVTFAFCYGTTTVTSPHLSHDTNTPWLNSDSRPAAASFLEGRRVKSPFNLILLRPCIKSKGILGTEWTHRHMIVLAEYKCIDLVLLSLQESLSPTAQKTALLW